MQEQPSGGEDFQRMRTPCPYFTTGTLRHGHPCAKSTSHVRARLCAVQYDIVKTCIPLVYPPLLNTQSKCIIDHGLRKKCIRIFACATIRLYAPVLILRAARQDPLSYYCSQLWLCCQCPPVSIARSRERMVHSLERDASIGDYDLSRNSSCPFIRLTRRGITSFHVTH